MNGLMRIGIKRIDSMMTLEKYYEQAIKGESDHDAKSHIDWLNSYRQEWMTDDQWLLALFLCRLFRGFHHSPEIKKTKLRNQEYCS